MQKTEGAVDDSLGMQVEAVASTAEDLKDAIVRRELEQAGPVTATSLPAAMVVTLA